MYAIPSSRYKKYPRPLQGGARVVASGGRAVGGGIAGSYRAAMNKANRANEKRYKAILKGYDDLRARVLGGLEGAGEAERADITREYQGASAGAQNYLVQRGFGNSSLHVPMQAAVMRAKNQSLGALNERVQQNRARYDVDLTDRKLGVMERRYDNGPDYNQMIGLGQGLGRSGLTGGGMIGQPIGVPPAMYANAFNQAMMQHLGQAGMGMRSPRDGPVPWRNLQTQALRYKRLGRPVPAHLKQYLPR